MAKTAPQAEQAPAAARALAPHEIILRPLVTEKGTTLAQDSNQYTFEVNPQATKDDVRGAIELLFDVKVVQVRIQNRKGKPRRYRFRKGHTKRWKKAIVTLDPENRIDFF
jgi:large subunit ribosomal protein L23